MKTLRRYWPHATAMLVLLAVFALYIRPEFMVDLANQVWACF